MRKLIDNLRSLNSKERFFLVGHILGNTDFTPCQAFKESIEKSLGVKIPQESFAAMDYHLDWLYASLWLTFNDGSQSEIFSNADHIIKGQQEDIDFIIAFAEGDSYHVILVEAKGVMGWSNQQMNSKAMRFGEIFGLDGKKWPYVKPHFVLLSPQRSKYLNVSKWPSWMAVGEELPWIELPVPVGLRKVTRCISEDWEDKHGQFWKVSSRAGCTINSSTRERKTPMINMKLMGKNYRGKLPFFEMVAKCRMEGDDILVGYNNGGANAMRRSTPAYIKERRYKWDLKKDPLGSKSTINWMTGNEFLKIVSEQLPGSVS